MELGLGQAGISGDLVTLGKTSLVYQKKEAGASQTVLD